MSPDTSPPEPRSAGSAARDGAAGEEADQNVERPGLGSPATDRKDGSGRLESEGEDGRYPVQAPGSDEFGREGWAVVAILFVSFLVVPPAIVLLPEARGVIASLGLTMRDAYLALPMIPAVLLGIAAVWAAVRTRRQ